MHSRAYLLLEREYEELQEALLYGISVMPAADNLLQWIARIRGLKDSLWEGAVLLLSMSYREDYNHHPPSVAFTTIPFHPNVDRQSGRPCMEFLDNPASWSPGYTMSAILLAIQTMLSNPVLEDAVNLEAADMMLNNPALYRQRILSCVTTSRQIASGSIQDYSPVRETAAPETPPAPRKTKAVSFEEYHRSWSEIATSAVAPHFQPTKSRGPDLRTKAETKTQHGNKLYNIVIQNPATVITSKARERDGSCVFCRLAESCGVDVGGHSDRSHIGQRSDTGRDVEPQEEEVDHLVAWTNTLHLDLLDD